MTRETGGSPGRAADAEAHLGGLLALLAAILRADAAFLLTPGADGDVLARSSRGAPRTLAFRPDDPVAASLFDRVRGRGARPGDGASLHPSLVAEVAAPVTRLITLPVSDAAGDRLGAVQIARTGEGGFPRSARRTAELFAPRLASALACCDEIAAAGRASTQHRDMLRSLTDGVIVVSHLGEITSCNEAAGAMLRLAPAAAVGQSITRVLGSMNGWLLEVMDRVADERETLRLADVEVFLDHDDRWLALDVALLPLVGGGGALDGLMLLLSSLDREKALRRAASRYVSPKMLDRVLDGQDARLEGRRQAATVLFSDIRGFTTMSEQIGAAATVQMLNEYFSFMEDVVSNHGGIIDKYIGDAVMAVFGPPSPGEQDADNAARAATDMIRALGILNGQRVADGQPAIRIGIGLATGPVIAGSIGSANRMDFTVIGDAVNLASRIEGMTKMYGADILLDGATAERLAGEHLVRHVDRVRVLGQRRPTDIHEIAASQPGDGADWKGGHEAALGLYVKGEWAAALAAFEVVLARRPLDGSARLMATRCAANGARPPANWDGVTDLDRK